MNQTILQPKPTYFSTLHDTIPISINETTGIYFNCMTGTGTFSIAAFHSMQFFPCRISISVVTKINVVLEVEAVGAAGGMASCMKARDWTPFDRILPSRKNIQGKKICFFGSSANPPHEGHRRIGTTIFHTP